MGELSCFVNLSYIHFIHDCLYINFFLFFLRRTGGSGGVSPGPRMGHQTPTCPHPGLAWVTAPSLCPRGLCPDCGGSLPPGANSGYTLGDPLRSGLCRMGERTFCSVLETSQDRMVSGRVDSTPSPAAPLEGRAPGGTSCPGPGAPARPGTPGKECGGRADPPGSPGGGAGPRGGEGSAWAPRGGAQGDGAAVLRTPSGRKVPMRVLIRRCVRRACPSLSLWRLEVPVTSSFL